MAVAPNVDLQDLQPDARNAVFAAMADLDKQGIPYTVTSGARTYDQQAALYSAYQNRGFTGLPAAPPGTSKHEVGDAVDISADPAHRQAVNDILSQHGLQWFGPGDHVHYTYTGPSAKAATDLSFLNTGPASPPTHDLSFLNTGGTAPKPKAATAPPDLSFLSTPKPAPAPKSIDLSFLNTPKAAAAPAPSTDLSFLQAPQSPTPPLFAGAAGGPAAPGALALPRGAAPLPGSVAPAGAGLQARQDAQAQENLGLPQKALNFVNTPISVASAFTNQLAREIGKTHEAGGADAGRVAGGIVFPELLKAVQNTPWAKTFMQGITGESSQFPELIRSFGQGSPTSVVGKFTQQHPAITTGLDFALSFPVLAATDSLQNEAVGLLGRGLSALNQATGVGDKIISSIPGLQGLLQSGRVADAVREVVGKNVAGFDHYYRDAAAAAEDSRVTSQKYLNTGANIATKSPITGQPVNKLEELVADYMDAGNPGSKYQAEVPAPHQVAADSATAEQMNGILTNARGALAKLAAGDAASRASAAQLLDRIMLQARESVPGIVEQGQAAALPGEEAAQRARAAIPGMGEAGRQRVKSLLQGAQDQSAASAGRSADLMSGVLGRARAAGQQMLDAGDLTKLADAAAQRQYNEFTAALKNTPLPQGQLSEMIGDMKQAGRDAVARAIQRPIDADAALQQAAEAQRQALLNRLGEQGRAKFQGIVQKIAADEAARQSLVPSLFPGAKRGAQQALSAGADEGARVQGQLNQIFESARQAKAAILQRTSDGDAATQQFLGRIMENARAEGRGMAYNDLGDAAQQAYRGQQRVREVGQIAQDAAAHGIDMADVQRIGDQYTKTFDSLGQHLVDMGLMKPEAYANLKGQYLPRLYLMTKGQPGDVDTFLKFLDSQGALTPEAVAAAQQRGLTRQWQSGVGPRAFTQSRELTDFGARNDPALARALVPEATPAALHGIEAQTRTAGIASGMREIAQNPDWAVPLKNGIPPVGKENFVPFPGKGPLQDMAVHPAVMRVLEEAKQPNVSRATAQAMFGPKLGEAVHQGNQVVRKAMLAGPSTIANVGVGHYYFAAAKAAEEGTHFTPLDYALAARDMRTAAKGGAVDPYLHEAMNKTDLLSRGASILPQEAKRVSGGVGLESPLQNAGRAVKAAGAKYLNATHDILAAGKFGLYRQLRKAGKSIDDAARMTRNATINYQGLPPAIRTLDQGMIAPFITFTARAIPLAGKMALRSPGLTSLATGGRLNWYLDRMADRLDQSRGLPGGAVAARQSGAVGPTTFALPGVHTPEGQQQYAQAPLLAPLLHHLGGGTSITEPVMRQMRGLAPVLSTAYQLALGQDLRGDQPRPIVPPGLPAGSTAEAAGERIKWVLHALAPPIGGLDRIKNAAQGTTPYAQAGMKPQTTGEAALQFFTGTRLGTAPSLLPSRQTPPALSGAFAQSRGDAALAEEKRSGGAAAGQAALDRLSDLFDKGSRDPSFAPNKGLADHAAQMSNPELRDNLAAVRDRLPNVVFGEHYTGSDKVSETNRLIDWAYTLLHESENPTRNMNVKIRNELFPLNRTLGAVSSP